MAKGERLKIIEQIQKKRGTFLISYVTSTRPNMEASMAMDSIRKIYEHLRLASKPGKKLNIDLFLHSNGGDGIVPWRLVTLIREYADKFSVLIPHRAFSAATLTALGADSIIMHPMGMLGPTDPTVANAFNPPNPNNPGKHLGISVEDVTAYLSLIKEDAGIQHEDEVVQAFNKLADKVHPLALGNVKRSLSQSRMMAEKLLCLHMDEGKEQHKISEIVENLTSKLFFHGHPVNRKEAKEQIGLSTVTDPFPEIEDLMWQLYSGYEQEIKMEEPFDSAMEFVAQFPDLQHQQNIFTFTPLKTAKLVYIESEKRTDVCSIDYILSGQKAPNGMTQVAMIFQRQGWVVE